MAPNHSGCGCGFSFEFISIRKYYMIQHEISEPPEDETGNKEPGSWAFSDKLMKVSIPHPDPLALWPSSPPALPYTVLQPLSPLTSLYPPPAL